MFEVRWGRDPTNNGEEREGRAAATEQGVQFYEKV